VDVEISVGHFEELLDEAAAQERGIKLPID
jgi:hypothetical protein